MNYTEQLRVSCKKTFFGIEIETCVHMLEEGDHRDPEKALAKYYRCLVKKSRGMGIKWETDPEALEDADFEPTSYDSWRIQPDLSVGCSIKTDQEEDTTCIHRLHKKRLKYCRKYDFFPVEIITPKLSVPRGFDEFITVWFGLIMGENFVYTSNTTQGLHINISHKKINSLRSIEKFVGWWKTFEPIVLQILPQYRRVEGTSYAVPLTHDSVQHTPTMELLTDPRSKHFAINLQNVPSRVSDSTQPNKTRLEVRIYQGSMDIYEIYYWAMFCIIFLNMSIVIDTRPPEFSEQNIGKLFKLLLKLVVDDGTQRFLLQKYRINKLSNWPTVNYSPSNTHLFRNPWKHLNERLVFDKQNESCK
jgi:hypothetical protein